MAYNPTSDKIEFSKQVAFPSSELEFSSDVRVADGSKLKVEHLYDKDGNQIVEIGTFSSGSTPLTFQGPVTFNTKIRTDQIASVNSETEFSTFANLDKELDKIHERIAGNTSRTKFSGHEGKLVIVGPAAGESAIQPATISTDSLIKNTGISQTISNDNGDTVFNLAVKSDAGGDMPSVQLIKNNSSNVQQQIYGLTLQDWGAIQNTDTQHRLRVGNNEKIIINTSDTQVHNTLDLQSNLKIAGNLPTETSFLMVNSSGTPSFSDSGDLVADTITVDRIKFDDADADPADSTTSPSIHDFNDSLIFDVGNGERYSFKVNNIIVGEINSNGLHDFFNCDVKSGGQFKIDGTQISSSALSNDSSIIKTGTAFNGRLLQDATYSGVSNSLQETEISALNMTGNTTIASGSIDIFKGSIVAGKGVFSRLELLEDPIPSLNSNSNLEQPRLGAGYNRLQEIMKPADQDFTKIYKVVFHQMKCAGGFMNSDHLSGLGNSAKPKSFRHNSSVQPVLLGTHTNDMNTFTKEDDPSTGTTNQLSIDFGQADYDNQTNSFVTGVGFINWGHDGWFDANIRNKQNKICWLGTRADDAVNVTIDGVRIAATKFLGSESVSGTGNDDVFHMFVARGEISSLEIMFVGKLDDDTNAKNEVELDFGVIGAF
jgi:hypothetical protein